MFLCVSMLAGAQSVLTYAYMVGLKACVYVKKANCRDDKDDDDIDNLKYADDDDCYLHFYSI